MKNIWVPLSGAIAAQKQVETIANNVANANTIGFKKDDLVFKEHLTAIERGLEDVHIPRKEFSPRDFYHSHGSEKSFVDTQSQFTNFRQGQLTPTQNPLDFSIQGPAFFEMLTPYGIRYSRKGSFSLDGKGFIVNSDGAYLLSQKSDNPAEALESPQSRRIQVDQNVPINLSDKGILTQAGQTLGKISIVEFIDIHALRKEGGQYFISPGNQNLSENIESRILQGFVEESNVNVVSEMANLIRANRHFESMQKAIKTYDSINSKAINELGR